MSPVPGSYGDDFPRLIDELVPGIAAVVEDIRVGLEDPVREPVVADELPDVFDWVEFGGSGRQGQESDVIRHLQPLGAMPAGLIEDDDGVGPRFDGP